MEMSTVVKKLDPSEINHMPYEPYRWDIWADGETRIFTQDVDYSCTSAAFRSAAHQAAKVRGLSVRTKRIPRQGKPDQMVVTFYK